MHQHDTLRVEGKGMLGIVGLLVGAFIAQACGGSPIEPSGTNPGAAGGSGCQAMRPNYQVSALRWENFPIRVYIEDIELTRRGFSVARTAAIADLIMRGLGSWAAATNGRIGATTRVTDASTSHLNVVFRNNSGHTIHDARTGNYIQHATVLVDPHFTEAFADRDHRWINMAAHEMGHVLGIVEHPAGITGSLMVNEAEQVRYEGPQPYDVNSILIKYGLGCP
jgi:hypothetical protein